MKRFLVWVLLGAVACGSSSTTSPNNNTNMSNPGGGKPPAPAGPSESVTIMNYAFSPSSLSVKAGTTVTWTNYDAVAHTSTADAGAWNSGQLGSGGSDGYGGTTSGGSYSHTFPSAGTFTYHCANHSYMTGTVTVTP